MCVYNMVNSNIKMAIAMVAIIIGVVGIISVALSQIETKSYESGTIEADDGTIKLADIDKSDFRVAPDLVGIAEYINTTPEELQKQIDDSVVLYDIWTYSCINCVRTLPYITAWDTKYADQGLLIIGVHSPEFEFEKDLGNVMTAVEKYDINYPVVLDNDMDTWKAFENRYWPRKYVADHEGYIRYDKIGEGGYEETEKIIQDLLKERSLALGLDAAEATSFVDINEFEHTLFRTPELYFGYELAYGRNHIGNNDGALIRPNVVVDYAIELDDDSLLQDKFYVEGTWRNNPDHMRLVSEGGGVIKLPYTAKQVNIVANVEGSDDNNNLGDVTPARLEILIDGVPIQDSVLASSLGDTDVSVDDGILIVDGPKLYNIVNAESSSSHLLEIRVSDVGFEMYTFTFG